MDLIIVGVLFIGALTASLLTGINILIPLVFGLVLLMLAALRRGHKLPAVLKMVWKGGSKAAIVLVLFLFISFLTAAWRASGTIPMMVDIGIRLIAPELFLLFAFFITAAVAFLIGSSFGSCGTIGVAMLILARAGGVSLPIAAGAILSGAYFGDRTSLFSATANYVASLTKTSVYTNLSRMLKTAILPVVSTCAVFAAISLLLPMESGEAAAFADIGEHFKLNFWAILPALILLALALFRCNVKIAVVISTAAAILVAIFVQGEAPLDMLKYLYYGYTPASTEGFGQVIGGGGFRMMIQTWLIVILSSTYAGIFEGTGMLSGLDHIIVRFAKKTSPYIAGATVGLTTSLFSCNQTLAVTLTHQVMRGPYEQLGLTDQDLAIDMSNGVEIIAPLIPWNIAAATALAMMGFNTSAVPFAFYMILTVLLSAAASLVKKRKVRKESKHEKNGAPENETNPA